MPAIGPRQVGIIRVHQIGAGNTPRIFPLLMHPDGAIAPVVGHDHHHRRAMLHRRRHLVQRHLETAVPGHADHHPRRMRQLGRNRRRKAVAHRLPDVGASCVPCRRTGNTDAETRHNSPRHWSPRHPRAGWPPSKPPPPPSAQHPASPPAFARPHSRPAPRAPNPPRAAHSAVPARPAPTPSPAPQRTDRHLRPEHPPQLARIGMHMHDARRPCRVQQLIPARRRCPPAESPDTTTTSAACNRAPKRGFIPTPRSPT